METDFLTADFGLGCVVTVFGRCYHVVSSASRPYDVLLSTWSRPEVDLIKVEGMEGTPKQPIDTKLVLTIFLGLSRLEIQNQIGRKKKF